MSDIFTRVELHCSGINVLRDYTMSYYFLSLVISDESDRRSAPRLSCVHAS